MFVNLKALVVVLAFATVIFALAKPLFLRFTAPEDFSRRRMVWFLLTIAEFVIPNFWLYLLFAAPLIVWAAQKDSSPLALYLLLFFVIPPLYFAIPTVLINQLFALSNARILAFTILLPAVLRWMAKAPQGQRVRLNGLDVVLLLYGVLQLVLLIPYESPTNTLRRGFLYLLDTYLVYFAFSRLLTERRQIADTMGALCLAALIFAPIAAFESLRGWLLYTGVSEAWGQPNGDAWLFRGDALRAQATTGHSITLGYILALAIGFWMYLKAADASKMRNAAVFGLLSIGLFVTYARGPWLSAALVAVTAVVLGSRNAVQMVKVFVAPAAVVAAIIASPFGARFIDLLPFIGTAGQETVEQRQRLVETSWRLVQQNPLFGNPFVLLEMEDLRLGQTGIIDLVNGYAQVALYYGLVGLALFLAMFLGSLAKAYSTLKLARAAGDAEMVWMGASLIACLVSSLFLMATSGQLYLQWVSVALLVSYAGLQVAERPAVATAVVRPNAFRSRRTASP
jgi:O-antigen ligase